MCSWRIEGIAAYASMKMGSPFDALGQSNSAPRLAIQSDQIKKKKTAKSARLDSILASSLPIYNLPRTVTSNNSGAFHDSIPVKNQRSKKKIKNKTHL
jgi:hypothetical protein